MKLKNEEQKYKKHKFLKRHKKSRHFFTRKTQPQNKPKMDDNHNDKCMIDKHIRRRKRGDESRPLDCVVFMCSLGGDCGDEFDFWLKRSL